MKNFLYIFVFFLSFSCKKDMSGDIKLPNGYYDYQIMYEGGHYSENGQIYLVKSNDSSLVVYDGESKSTLKILNEKVSGNLGLVNLNSTFTLDGSWSYDSKKEIYVINGTFTQYSFGMGGYLSIYQYGTFSLTKKK